MDVYLKSICQNIKLYNKNDKNDKNDKNEINKISPDVLFIFLHTIRCHF